MELIRIIKDFQPVNDEKLLGRAAELAPVLHHKTVGAEKRFQTDGEGCRNQETAAADAPPSGLRKGQSICFDFGRHLVGHVTLDLSYTGSHPDAPALLKLNFAETLKELGMKSEDYHGWVSGSWIQEEYIHVDEIPGQIRLPRRYAFRYLKITVLETSPKYQLTIDRAECVTETSADLSAPDSFTAGDPMLDKIYQVSLRTLADCMQDVFEDGPKRDRRLWVGDLRLEALANYASFQNHDLVKRCLYLFGGSRFPDGRVSACLFTGPEVWADDTYMFDYALLYVVTLEEYLRQTDDLETLNDLYDVAMRQVELSLEQCDEQHIVSEQAGKDSFIDWSDGLDKRACAQAVLIYTLSYARQLAERKNDLHKVNWLTERADALKRAAREHFWDPEQRCFVSNGQTSIASQLWMTLADVLTAREAAELMGHAERFMGGFPMATPYMHHHYIMALLHAGLTEKAIGHLKQYWGGMVEAGADTFWESWDPEDPDGSPYGGSIINSFCHGWSCTPAYILKSLQSQGIL